MRYKLGAKTEKGYLHTASHHLVIEDGKPTRKQKRFRLGDEATIAWKRSQIITSIYHLDGGRWNGLKVWSDAGLLEVKLRLAQIENEVGAVASVSTVDPIEPFKPATTTTPLPIPDKPSWHIDYPQPGLPTPTPANAFTSKTLSAAWQQWTDDAQNWAEVGVRHHNDAIFAGKRVTHYLTQSANQAAIKGEVQIADPVLATIDAHALKRIRNVFIARPTSDKGTPLGVLSVRNILSTIRRFLTYAKQNGWNAPAEWEEHFKLSAKQKAKLLSPQEEQAALEAEETEAAFTVPELTALYHLSNPFQKRMILCGLFFGFTQTPISRLRSDMFFVKDGETYMRQLRGKTKVRSVHWVPPELSKMIQDSASQTAHKRKNDPDKLVFCSPTGLPVKSENGKMDWVKDQWDALMQLATQKKVRRLPFKTLRDTGGQMIQDLSGNLYLAQVFMAHSSGTVLEQHYTNRATSTGVGKSMFEQMHDYQRKMYTALAPMFGKEAKVQKKELQTA